MTFGNATSLFDKRVYAQNSAPVDERNGNLWADTSVNPPVLKVYSTDTSAWERASPSNIKVQDTAPTGPAEGDGWVDTSLNPPQFKIYSGTKWVSSTPYVYYTDNFDTPADTLETYNLNLDGLIVAKYVDIGRKAGTNTDLFVDYPPTGANRVNVLGASKDFTYTSGQSGPLGAPVITGENWELEVENTGTGAVNTTMIIEGFRI